MYRSIAASTVARSSELEAIRLMTAEYRIRELLSAVTPTPAAQRAALDELDNAIVRETEIKPQYAASFWEGIRSFIAQQTGTA